MQQHPKDLVIILIPTVLTITSSTTFYYQIPNNIIIDAVQIQHPILTGSQRSPRKLVNAQDAGPTNVPDGEYSSQSLIRKTAKTVGGKKSIDGHQQFQQ